MHLARRPRRVITWSIEACKPGARNDSVIPMIAPSPTPGRTARVLEFLTRERDTLSVAGQSFMSDHSRPSDLPRRRPSTINAHEMRDPTTPFAASSDTSTLAGMSASSEWLTIEKS
jgi:hypothetical protein